MVLAVSWVEGGVAVEETDGHYGQEGFVYQASAALPDFDGQRPVFGLWVIDHEAAGLGVREDRRRITGNLSRFIPHFFSPERGHSCHQSLNESLARPAQPITPEKRAL